MIFSRDNWDNGKEIGQYVPASASLSFEKMESSLGNVQELFLIPLLGDDMMEAIEDIYSRVEMDDLTTEETKLLRLAQRAVANLAFWYDFDNLQVRISDQGFQRQGSEDWQQAYKYQEDRLREGFKVKGFNALDRLLSYLSEKADTFTDYESSPAYKATRKAIVRTVDEAQKYVNIDNSAIVYMRLAAEFPTVEEGELRGVLGSELYWQLRSYLDDLAEGGEEDADLEDLRKQCVRVMVCGAALRLLKQTGTLTDKGLYFEAVTANNTENRTRQPATDTAIGDRLSMYVTDLEDSKTMLHLYIREHLSDYADTKDGHIIRDNDGGSGFFAM